MSQTRALKPEEMAVLWIHVSNPGHAFNLASLDKRMGPKGSRSPVPEAQGFLIEQGLLLPAMDQTGELMAGYYTFSPAGERAIGTSLKATYRGLELSIRSAKNSGVAEEVQRLQFLKELLPPEDMAADGATERADADDDQDDEPRPTSGPSLTRAPAKHPRRKAVDESTDSEPKRTMGAKPDRKPKKPERARAGA